ncbi:MAG: hypothetical protein HZA16_03275 [Nitrospirae bacterium]|nr:hypothetical protein [Nitrospirota bacterium]
MQKCRSKKNGRSAAARIIFLILSLSLVTCYLLLVSSCGYRMIGSTSLPFHSVTIKQVRNRTYEPRLEERMHIALSREFISQGIEVAGTGGEVELEATVTSFQLGAIAAVDDRIKEQSILLRVDIKLTDAGRVTEFSSLESPIKITFQTTGTVSESVAFKELATDKACSEIAKELVGRIIITYAK